MNQYSTNVIEFCIGDIIKISSDGRFRYVKEVSGESDLTTTITTIGLSRWKLFRWIQVKCYNIVYKKPHN